VRPGSYETGSIYNLNRLRIFLHCT
jgi:hypothetical protein